MRATPSTGLILLAACLAAATHLSCGAQEVVFVDDFNAPRAQQMPNMPPRGAQPMSPSRQQALMHNGMSREQVAQALSQQAEENLQKQQTNPLSRLATGFKGLFTRDASHEPSQPPPPSNQQHGILQAGYSAGPQAAPQTGSPRSNLYRNNGGLPIRHGDQRQGLFDMAFGSRDAAPDSASEAASQARSRTNSLKPSALASSSRITAGNKASGSPLKSRQRNSSSGPSPLPQLSHAQTNRAPLSQSPAPMSQAVRSQALPTRGVTATPSKPSDGVVMISDMPGKPAEPQAPRVSDDEPLFITDLPSNDPHRGLASTLEEKPMAMVESFEAGQAPAPRATAAAPAPQPLVVENPQAQLAAGPLAQVTTPAEATPLPTVEPKKAAAAASPSKTNASKINTASTAPKTPKPSRPVVAVLPNPVEMAQEKKTEPSPRAAALLAEAHYLAQDAQSEQEFTRVVQQCRHVLAIDESSVAVRYSNELASWALNKRGELKADQGMVKEAMVDFDEAVEKDAGQWRAIHNRGVMQAQSGRFSEAFDAFNKTIELNPEFAKAYSNRASLYVQAGEFETALEDYRQAIVRDPDLVIAHKGRGRVCHVLGRLEQALQHFEAAALLSPDDAGIATCRADLLVDMGRFSQAASGYLRAIEIDPTDPIAHRNLAWLQATCPDSSYRDGDRALSNALRAIELSGGEDDICLDTLAAAQAAAGDFDAAVQTIKQAIALAPSSDQSEYAERLKLYEENKPFRSQPAGVRQASYDSANGAGTK